jgi:hypothetical protein
MLKSSKHTPSEFYMSTTSELSQLASLLHVTEAELSFLASVAPDKIQFLHSSIIRAMQIEQAPMWSRIAKATSLLPDRLTAKIAEGFLGAQVASNVTYHLPISRAVSISKHFSLPFLAETTSYLAADKIEALLNAFPMDKAISLTHYLIRQEDYGVMGRLLDYLQVERALLIFQRVPSDEDILRIAAAAQNKVHLAQILARLPEARLLRLLRQGIESDLLGDLLAIAQHLPSAQLHRLGRVAVKLTSEEKTAVYHTISQHQLTPSLQALLDQLQL